MKTKPKLRQKRAISVGENTSSKDTKQLAVSVAILELIESEGLAGVTHSKVSRRSHVSRAWIYEYLGNEKEALIEHGAEVFAGHLARVALSELPKSREELLIQLKDGVDFLFDSIEQNPLIIKLFYRFRGSSNSVGKVIQKYEQKWISNASRTLVNILGLSSDQAVLLAELALTLRLGFAHRLVTSSNPTKARERASNTFDVIHMMIAGTKAN